MRQKATVEERGDCLAWRTTFVTDLTSLVVIKPDFDPVINHLDSDQEGLRGSPAPRPVATQCRFGGLDPESHHYPTQLREGDPWFWSLFGKF